jgi:L-ascorbate metabolism protein UlaG (beta-lactamase superfamily)
MKKLLIHKTITIIFILFGFQANAQKTNFIPFQHATFIIQTDGLNILVDPGRGNSEKLANFHHPDLILITHEHGDHMDLDIIKALKGENTILIGPKTVVDKVGFGTVVNNNETQTFQNIKIKAIPMYNTTPERAKFHVKGVGNGYVLTIKKERIYIAGDTEDIPEMRELKKIDHAFFCMNLPYTMSVEQAASAILEMKPKNVYPYHYRNSDKTYSAIRTTLKDLLSVNKKIKIHYLKWYDEE